MISIDTNLLFHAFAQDRPEHLKAFSWISDQANNSTILISEFILIEFYTLLRNPSVLKNPLSAKEAGEVIKTYRHHPTWRLVGFPSQSQEIHDELHHLMTKQGVAFRRIYDTRTALSLRRFGVTDFATCNVKDFQGFGFKKVWNPLVE